MTIPATTDEFLNLNILPFTANGGLTVIDDQHTSNSTGLLDGVNDFYSSTVKPFIRGSGERTHSFSFWIRADDPTTSSLPITQHGGAADRGFIVLVNTTLMVEFSSGGATDTFRSTLAAGTDNWDDGKYHLITVTTTAGTDLKIYIDGVEASSYASKNIKTGAGFDTGFSAGIENLEIGSFGSGAGSFFQGIVSRPKFWRLIELTAAQVLEEFNKEVAAIPSDGLRGGVGRPNFRLDCLRQTRYNRGLVRFDRR